MGLPRFVAAGRPSGEGGLALLEVLIASLLVGFAIAALALLFAHGQAFTATQTEGRVAISLAQQRVEELRAIALIGFDCIPVAADPGTVGQVMGPNAGCTVSLVYNERVFRDPTSNLLIYNPVTPPVPTPQYTRTTVVRCADPDSLNPISCPAEPAAVRATVTVTPLSTQTGAITVDAVLSSH